MIEHGPSCRPYDCSLCAKKFYFRAELENHLIDHESGRIPTPIQPSQTDSNSSSTSNDPKQIQLKREHDIEFPQMKASNKDADNGKDSPHQERQQTNADDDDEYIEVEQIGSENSAINHESRADIKTQQQQQQQQHSENNDKYDENDWTNNVESAKDVFKTVQETAFDSYKIA